MQKSYCYTPGVSVGVHVGVGVHMQNVRANVKVMEFQSLCIFSCILTLLIILIKPLTTKAHDRRASGDCGTSGMSSAVEKQHATKLSDAKRKFMELMMRKPLYSFQLVRIDDVTPY